ncbi:hypothetical protein H7K45_18435 [Mycobacterium yunnanensis]|uniref:Uncharacterized protein n=1 Tax=Mycobacterium yunnanensis TaxID=368477 RepID=A0A9X3C2E1_9MYCO|nr:hypothetical protein [Mycobacterium yunnanensis]MCV7422528.1 hypothetical protein [Mycobacterium yunnanensis]
MLMSDDKSRTERQFHWLPFTAMYWIVALIVAIAMGNAWALFVFWLANPVILAVCWLLWVKVLPRLRTDESECARRDSNP